MKELSVEEKAKAYDEALKKAEKLLKEEGNKLNVKTLCEYFFPKLKESENERMKFLIKGCVYASNITPEGREEIFAWLEKQGKETSWKPTYEQMTELNHLISGCSYEIEIIKELQKQLESLKNK